MGDRLKGKRVIFVGAATGIGKVTIKRFVDEGAKAILVDAQKDVGAKTAKEYGADFIQCDITDEAAVKAMVDQAAKLLGGIDVVVNNAAIQFSGSVTDFDAAKWDKIFAVNVKGMFLTCKYAVPHLRKSKAASIINTASLAGKRGGPGMTAYSSTKGAVIAFTVSLAMELAADGIRVNAVCPGWVDTPFNGPAIDYMGGADVQQKVLASLVPLGRQAVPSEIAPLFVYLASDEFELHDGSVNRHRRRRVQLGIAERRDTRKRQGGKMTMVVTATPVAARKPGDSMMIRLLRRWGTICVIVIVGIGFALASPYFATVSNLNNILFAMIVSALVSIGLTYVVVAGSFDLSIGMTVTTASIVTAYLMPTTGPFMAVVGALLAACLIGLVNGLLVTYGRLSGIVVTLGMMFVLGGINQFITNGYQIAIDYQEVAFRWIGQGRVGPIAVPVLILLAVFALCYLLQAKTKAGHYISAVGDNAVAAYYSGIPVYRWIIMSFVLAALMSGIGGVILTSISSSAQPVGGQGYLLEAFAAVFLGATILGKGKPHVLGTLLGVFFLYMVSAGMNMVGVPFAARQLFNGLVLIAAVGANALLNREEIHLKFI
ncbi:MAG: SDR family oxidoreductase [Mesorhizobium sp.]